VRGLKGKKAIVTGAASGLGLAIVKEFLTQGVDVVCADCNYEKLLQINDELKEFGNGDIYVLKVDVTNEKSVKEMVRYVEKIFENIDILVNSAGIIKLISIYDMTLSEWQKIIDVNLTGTFLCCKYVSKIMKTKKSGKIINISSKSGKKGSADLTGYCASKFGIIGLTQSLAYELAPFNINVNAVCPGVIYTPIWGKLIKQYVKRERISEKEMWNRILKKIPLGRLCKPEDVVNLVLFLASDKADYMTGQALNITGGTEMR